jgi:hypothetical protein
MSQKIIYPWSLFLLLLCLSSQVIGEEERKQLHDQLLEISQQITEVQKQFAVSLKKAKINKSPITLTLATFQANAKEWQQNVDDESQNLASEPVIQFCESWKQLKQRLSTISGVAEYITTEHITTTTDRCPRIATTPELQRYHTFIKKFIEQLLDDSNKPAIETDTDFESQRLLARHHQLLLKALEGTLTTDEKWTHLPINAPALTEFLGHCRSVMGSMEHAIVQGPLDNEAEIKRDETILSLLEELVQAAQLQRELLSENALPHTSHAVVAYNKCKELEATALHARIAHRRTLIIPDAESDGIWEGKDEQLIRAHDDRKRLSVIAEEWLTLTADLPEKVHSPDVILAGLPADLRAEISKQWTAIDAVRSQCETSLAQSLAEGNRIRALRAKGELSIAIRQHEMIEENLDEQRDHTVLVTALRAKAADPKVAALLLKIDTVNKAFILAQKKLNISELAALHGQLAIEIATAEAKETQQAKELATHSAETLNAERESLIEEATELIGETPQGPPPDQSPPF